MAAIAIIRDAEHSPPASPTVSQTTAVFESQGFEVAQVERVGASTVLWFNSPYSATDNQNWISLDDGFIASVGYLVYRGKHGRNALISLWNDFSTTEGFAPDELYGNFQIAIRHGSRACLFGDALGLIHLYRSHNGNFFSTSWLACLQLIPTPKLDRIGAQDYILNGASHNHRTAVRQISLVAANARLDLITGTETITSPVEWREAVQYSDSESAADRVAEALLERTRVNLYTDPQEIVSALSGGFDSRLILSALIATNTNSELFVYGRDGDQDVQIATDLADFLGLPLTRIDKAAIDNGALSPDKESILSNAMFFDGTPIDGLFDRGSDRKTRLAHADSGKLQLNGGGGEIFRNFFYLRNRRYSPTDIVFTFYHPFVSDVFHRRSEYSDYISTMAEGIHSAAGSSRTLLSREEVEALYPFYRVRFWTSRTNSIVARYGRYYTPLVDPVLVRLALSIPLGWKHAGEFESRMIARLSPSLASRPLNYGFSPADGPGAGYRLAMSLQQARSPAMRRLSPRVKRWLKRNEPPLECPSPGEFPGELQIAHLLRIENLQSAAQINRAYSVEALMRAFSIQPAT